MVLRIGVWLTADSGITEKFMEAFDVSDEKACSLWQFAVTYQPACGAARGLSENISHRSMAERHAKKEAPASSGDRGFISRPDAAVGKGRVCGQNVTIGCACCARFFRTKIKEGGLTCASLSSAHFS